MEKMRSGKEAIQRSVLHPYIGITNRAMAVIKHEPNAQNI